MRRQDSIVFYCGLVAAGLLTYFWIIPQFIRRRANVLIGPEFFPQIVVTLFILLSLVGIFLEYKAMKAEGENFAGYSVNLKQYIPHALFILSGVIFVMIAPILGFVVAAMPFLLFLLILFGADNKVQNIVITIIYPIILFWLFRDVLGVRFPIGMFGI